MVNLKKKNNLEHQITLILYSLCTSFIYKLSKMIISNYMTIR